MTSADRDASTPTSILLCTLGASWAVVAEAYSFLAPSVLDLYELHPARSELDEARAAYAIQPPGEVWVITTSNALAGDATAVASQLWSWWKGLRVRPVLRLWVASDVDALASAKECSSMRELTLRVALLAAAHSPARLVMSLAGGRKTMSADLQRAAQTLGSSLLIHVVGADSLPAELRSPTPELLQEPLPPALAAALRPVVIGRGHRSELLDLETAEVPAVTPRSYPVPLAPECGLEGFRYQDWQFLGGGGPSLHDTLERREHEAHALLERHPPRPCR